jgi:hypothetical protein
VESVIVGEFRKVEELYLIILVLIAVDSEVGLNILILPLGLAI